MKSKDENISLKRKASAIEQVQLDGSGSLEVDGIMEIGEAEFYQQKAPKRQKEITDSSSTELLPPTIMEELLKLMFSQPEVLTPQPLNPNSYSSIFSPLNEPQQTEVMTQTVEGNNEGVQILTIDDEDKGREKELVTDDNRFPTTTPAQSHRPIFYLDDNKSIQELENSIHLSVNGSQVNFQYKSGKKDQPDLVYIAPLNLISSQQIHYGVYARRFIKKGTVLFEYTGEKVSDEENQDEKKDRDYFMFLKNRNKILDAKYRGNVSRFINASTIQENVEFIEKKKRMLVIAARDIYEDEQLLVDYGKDYYFCFKPLFLHPSDNFRCAQEIFEEYRDHYHPVPYNFANCTYDLSPLGITKEDTAFLPKPVYEMLQNRNIRKYDSISHLPLPILKVKDGQFMPLWQQERITLLLMAAFLGNVTVLKKLLQNPKMDTTIQQSMSGRTALHLACLGTSLDRTPRDIKNRLAALDLLIEKPGLDFKDRNHRTPIFTLIDNGSPNYLKHLLQKIKPSVTNFQRHKKNRLDPFFYALKKNKKDHASVIIDYMDSIGKLSKYAEHIKEFVRKALIFNNGHCDLKLIAACNEVLEKKGIPGIVVKMPNLFKPLVSIPNDQNMICRGNSQSNLPL